jgi:hypothetical protein
MIGTQLTKAAAVLLITLGALLVPAAGAQAASASASAVSADDMIWQ